MISRVIDVSEFDKPGSYYRIEREKMISSGRLSDRKELGVYAKLWNNVDMSDSELLGIMNFRQERVSDYRNDDIWVLASERLNNG